MSHNFIVMLSFFMMNVVMLSVIMLDVTLFYCYAEFLYDECCNAEGNYARCHIILLLCWVSL